MRSEMFKLALVALGLWWVYLFFTTQFMVVFDSEGYEDVGKLIASTGWAEFLRQGRNASLYFPAGGLVHAFGGLVGDFVSLSF